jgi:hypothetical protein
MTPRMDSWTHSLPALQNDCAPGPVVNNRIEISHPVPCDTPRSKGAAVGKLAPSLFWKALAGLLAFDVLGFGCNFVRMHRFVSNWKVSVEELRGDSVDKICTAVNDACVWYPKRIRCLQRSVITTCLMRHCGVPAKMALGTQLIPFRGAKRRAETLLDLGTLLGRRQS